MVQSAKARLRLQNRGTIKRVLLQSYQCPTRCAINIRFKLSRCVARVRQESSAARKSATYPKARNLRQKLLHAQFEISILSPWPIRGTCGPPTWP